jgi:hypothetical protein
MSAVLGTLSSFQMFITMRVLAPFRIDGQSMTQTRIFGYPNCDGFFPIVIYSARAIEGWWSATKVLIDTFVR